MTKEKVLIVDDDRLVRETLAELLVLLGYQPLVATNASEGLACLGREQVGLAIVDIKMPVMDGIEMMKRVKQRSPDLDVILMSGYQPDSSWDALMEAGASDYIMKPFNINIIEKKLQNLMERRTGQKTDT
jgi:DNA-binding NtrC family response regulator